VTFRPHTSRGQLDILRPLHQFDRSGLLTKKYRRRSGHGSPFGERGAWARPLRRRLRQARHWATPALFAVCAGYAAEHLQVRAVAPSDVRHPQWAQCHQEAATTMRQVECGLFLPLERLWCRARRRLCSIFFAFGLQTAIREFMRNLQVDSRMVGQAATLVKATDGRIESWMHLRRTPSQVANPRNAFCIEQSAENARGTLQATVRVELATDPASYLVELHWKAARLWAEVLLVAILDDTTRLVHKHQEVLWKFALCIV
jgi:hypothetical protein